MEPDPIHLPNRRHKTNWRKVSEETARIRGEARTLLNPMVGFRDGIPRYVEQERLRVSVEILWRKKVARFDTEATSMLVKPIIDALGDVQIIGNDAQIDFISYENHFSTTRTETTVVLSIAPYRKPDRPDCEALLDAEDRMDAFWLELMDGS